MKLKNKIILEDKKINKKILSYQNEGIFLIFNKLTTEYNLYINGILPSLIEKEISPEEKLVLLNKELSKSTFDDILSKLNLEDVNDIMKSVVKDYYLYYILKNETLKREINDWEKLCDLLEMICNFQFELNLKKEINKNDLLNIIMWTNDFYSEINEFLFCVEYFHLGKYFNKKNIFKEILKKKDVDLDITNDDIKYELKGIKKGMEIILSVFNDLCLEFHDNILTKHILEIIPTMYNINEKYKLKCKELYFLIQIKYALKIFDSLDKGKEMNDKNIFTKFLKNLLKYRYSYQEKNINDNSYDDLIFKQYLPKFDIKKRRCIIKILVQEYKKRIKDEKILDILLNILKSNESLLKTSQLLFHEILSKYFNGTEINIFRISYYNTSDHFLILIGSFSNNEYIEQILLEVFESKFNAHFMSYTNEINKTINYENISNEKADEIFKGKNLEMFKKCIDLLEDQNIRLSNQRFLPNIVYCAYIKSYLYQFISYVFKKAEGLIDLSDITKSLTDGNDNEFKSKERKVMEIYSFRILLEYLNNDYNAFKSYAFDKKYLTYKNSFKDKDSFDDQIPKIIEFCGRTIEDFIKIKGETPNEPFEYQNFYINTFLSIKIVCGAINGQGISIDANGYKEIWDYFSSKLNDKVNKFLNLKYNSNDMYMNYFLSDILQKNLYNKIANNEFKLGNFTNDLNLEHLNNKTLSMIIYILRFCLHSYSVSGDINKNEKKENYFYSKLIDYNSQEDITKIISNNFIPGRMINDKNKGIKRLSLKELCLLDFENKDNIINEEPKIELISIIMLRFLFYSHLFVSNLLGKITDDTFNSNYSITEGHTCLKTLISLWDILNSDKLIPGNETNKVEIFLNRVNKEIAECYKKCEDFTNIENVNKFEKHFNEYIIKCLKEYEYFKLIFVDKTMKAIIQQNNFPLSYGDDYPFMKYFVLISYPNIEHLKQKIKGNEEDKKLYLTQNMMEYDENLSEEKFRKIFENKLNNKFNMMIMDISTLSPYSYKNTKLFDLIINNKNILKKYYKVLIKKGINYSLEEFNKKIIELANISNEISKKFLENFLNKLKLKNNYLYKNIRRPMLSQSALNDEHMLFDIKKISEYKSYTHFLSKYIYKDIFTEDKKELTKYIDFEINIDYNNYNMFDIDIEEFEDELESIILSNKRLFYSDDYNITSIYNFDNFRGKRNCLLSDFIRQYKKGFEFINCQEHINEIIDINNNKNLIRIFFGDAIDAFSAYFGEVFIEGNNDEFIELNNIVKEPLKNNLLEKLEKNGIKLKQQIVFNFIFCIYNNLLKIINFLIDKKISLEISISDFITNLPDIYNISFYTKYFFQKNKNFKLKHIYYIFEEFELYLFPFMLLQVKDKYKKELYDEDKENIINYFKNSNEEMQFTIKEFINVLRKFISRYLITSDFNIKKYDIYCDNPLIDYLNKKDLWPLNLIENYMDVIEKGINDLKEFNFLVQHSVCLYQCLSGIKFKYDGNIINEGDNYIINESDKEKNVFNELSYFNDKNSDICNLIKIKTIWNEQDLSDSILFIFFNLQNNLFFSDIYKDIKTFLYLTYSNAGVCCNSINIAKPTEIKNDENKKEQIIFESLIEINEISKLTNSNLNNIQNITFLNFIQKNDILCIGTNNSKLMIVKLKDNFANIELLQDIKLPESCANNIEIFNGGQSLIVANGKHILLYELKEDNNNFNTYELKKDINTDNNSYILKIDSNNIAAFISPNIIRFYCIKNNEFFITKELKDIKCEITSANQKQYKTMNLIGKNNDILAICSNEHNIYLIDLSIKKEKKEEIHYERCSGNFDDWFWKHSSIKKNENIENIDENISCKVKEKINKEEEINANIYIDINNNIDNINTNENKKMDYVNWFKNHSIDNIIIDNKSGKKYDVINCSLNECKNNFVSAIKYFEDYIFLLDDNNKITVALIVKKEEKIEKLKYIGQFDYHDIICLTPFGFYLSTVHKAPGIDNIPQNMNFAEKEEEMGTEKNK